MHGADWETVAPHGRIAGRTAQGRYDDIASPRGDSERNQHEHASLQKPATNVAMKAAARTLLVTAQPCLRVLPLLDRAAAVQPTMKLRPEVRVAEHGGAALAHRLYIDPFVHCLFTGSFALGADSVLGLAAAAAASFRHVHRLLLFNCSTLSAGLGKTAGSVVENL